MICIGSLVQNFYVFAILGSIHALKDIPPKMESLTIKIIKTS